MPSFVSPWKFQPWRLGAHRAAAIALFRALISKCRQAPLNDDEKGTLHNIIRGRFERFGREGSRRHLSIAFTGGYEAIELLNASIGGDSHGLETVRSLIAQTPDCLKQRPTPKASKARKAKGLIEPSLKSQQLEKPDALQAHATTGDLSPAQPQRTARENPSIFSRSYLDFLGSAGVRKIPRLTSTSGFFFLRIKKPQPKVLTGMLTSKKKQKQARVNRKDYLERYLRPLGNAEDNWDAILRETFGTVSDNQNTKQQYHWEEHMFSPLTTWSRIIEDGIVFLQNTLMQQNVDNEQYAYKLLKIVNAEKRLASIEKVERRLRRVVERREKIGRKIDAVSNQGLKL